MNIIKKRMDNLGRIVIPKSIRNELKILDDEEFDMYVLEDKIILNSSSLLEKNKNKIEFIQTFILKYLNISCAILNNKKQLLFNNIVGFSISNSFNYLKLDIICDSFIVGYIYFNKDCDLLICKDIVQFIVNVIN